MDPTRRPTSSVPEDHQLGWATYQVANVEDGAVESKLIMAHGYVVSYCGPADRTFPSSHCSMYYTTSIAVRITRNILILLMSFFWYRRSDLIKLYLSSSIVN
jgi:hypothetical protein